VNTRLQVEHPVTEMVTGLDLVKLQLRVAAGEPLPFGQADVALRGHAIECRIYAEDPANHFFPSPGKILTRTLPAGPGIRLDDGVYPGWEVSSEYDPLLGKLIAWGTDRAEAIARMRRALGEYFVTGIRTNTQLFRKILDDAEFRRGEIHTRWLDERLASLIAPRATDSARDRDVEDAAMITALVWHLRRRDGTDKSAIATDSASRWKLEARREQVDREPPR